EFHRRPYLFSVRNVQKMQLAVARECIENPLTGGIGRSDDGSRCLSSGTERISCLESRSLSYGWVIEMFVPDNLSGGHIDRINVVGDSRLDGKLLRTARCLYAVHNERWEQRVHFS